MCEGGASLKFYVYITLTYPSVAQRVDFSFQILNFCILDFQLVHFFFFKFLLSPEIPHLFIHYDHVFL